MVSRSSTPDGGAHRDDAILAEKAVAGYEVLAQRHPLNVEAFSGLSTSGARLPKRNTS